MSFPRGKSYICPPDTGLWQGDDARLNRGIQRSIMITFEYIHGLGNNLFQYAYARTLAERHGFKLIIPSKIEGLVLDQVEGHTFTNDKTFVYDDEHFDVFYPKPRHYHVYGFFQKTKLYDLNKLRSYIKFEQSMTRRPDADVIVHVRLGDYLHVDPTVDQPLGWFVGRKYFDIALGYFPKSRYNRFAISDEPSHPIFIELCRKHELTPLPRGCQVMDLLLLSSFENLIISNSTYGWWGGLLSGSNNVVYPYNASPWPLIKACRTHIPNYGPDLRVRDWFLVDLEGENLVHEVKLV